MAYTPLPQITQAPPIYILDTPLNTPILLVAYYQVRAN